MLAQAAQPSNAAVPEEGSTSIVNRGCAARTRGLFVSVLEMMSTTLCLTIKNTAEGLTNVSLTNFVYASSSQADVSQEQGRDAPTPSRCWRWPLDSTTSLQRSPARLA